MRIERASVGDVDELAALLVVVVRGGASLGFVEPFDEPDARAWWQSYVSDAHNIVLVARDDTGLLGTASLSLATPANGAHRAEVRKMMVRPAARRRGIGAALLSAVEEAARAAGRSLLVLDTVTGSVAEALYRGQGYVESGRIPSYARNPGGDRLESTTIFYKLL